jgi:carboxyl-terminal processing protease
MTRQGFALILLALSIPLTAQSGPKTNYSDLFQRIWQTVNDDFYDPNFLGISWTAVRKQYEPKAAAVSNDAEFATLMNQMLHEIPVTHLAVRMPEKEGQSGIAVTTVEIAGKQLIASVANPSDAERRGLLPGDLLRTSWGNVRGDWGTLADIDLEDCNGHARTVSVLREPPGLPGRPSIRWRVIRPNPQRKIGYMQVVDFEDDVKDDFAPLVDKAMDELKETDGLIIDVRNNPGGNLSALRLVSYFTPTPRFAVALLSRTFLQHFGNAPDQMDPETIAKLPRITGAYSTPAIIDAMKRNGGGAAFYTEDVTPQYRGKIILLINEKTASAAEGFAGIMRGYPNTTLVGRTTMGAMVGAEDFTMPGGWILRFPTHASWRADGRYWRDEPVVPDVQVPLTRQDLCNSWDGDLAKALDLLGYK